MLTEEGLERLRLAEAFGLNAFYQEQVGNIIIPGVLHINISI